MAGVAVFERAAAAAEEVATWQVPASSVWDYEVSAQTRGLRYPASATLSWQTLGQRYRAELVFKAFGFGSRSQISTGWLGPHGLRPERFEEHTRRTRWLAFDWNARAGSANTLADGGQRQTGLPMGTLDRLGLFIQIGGTLAQQTVRPGQRLSWPVSSYSHWEFWVFEVREASPLALEQRTLPAWHLVRARERTDDAAVEIWYPVGWAGLPLRILIHQANSERIDQRLRRLPAQVHVSLASPLDIGAGSPILGL